MRVYEKGSPRVIPKIKAVALSIAASSAVFLAALMAGPLPQAVAQTPAAATSPYHTAPCKDVIGYTHPRTTCGYLDVKETPQGRDLSLAVAVISAVTPDANKEPVIFAHGGPGGAVVSAVRDFAQHPMNATRTVILFDQRGSGASLPLDCLRAPQEYLSSLAADLNAHDATAAQANIESQCHNQMINEGADLNGYGTTQTVGDMEVLREALGIDSWNVMGVSYGTTVALDYVRRHPERTRALVLDSVYPPSYASGGDSVARNFVRALEQLYADCRRDHACRHAYPGLETSYLATLIALGREPLEIPVDDRSLVPTGVYYLNPQDLTLIVHQMLYQKETISLVPKVIDLAARGNGQALSGLLAALGPRVQGIDLAARLSVECRERWLVPGRTLHNMSRLERFLRRSLTFFDTEDFLCPEWAPEFTDASFNEPVSSPVPAIFYSGANDPITPPENTLASFRRFPAGQYVHVLHTGHGVDRSQACVRGLTASFLDNPRELVADECVADVDPIPFVTDVALSRGVLPFAGGVLQMQSPFFMVTLGVGLLVTLGAFVWTITGLLRRERGRLPTATAVGAAALSTLCGSVLIVFFAVLTLAVADAGAGLTPAMLALGLPTENGWLLVLPWVALGLFGVGLIALGLTLMRGGVNTNINRPLVALTVGCALLLGTSWMMGFYASVA